MKIVIAGATGLVGEALVKRLIARHELVIFTRDVPKAREKFKGAGVHYADWHQPPSHLAALIDGTKVVINLAGAGIGDARWTAERKNAIIGSRLQSIEMLHRLFQAAEIQPELVIQASAIGYYGFSDEHVFSEGDAPGQGFLADVTRRWEEKAAIWSDISPRLVLLRSGVVLARNGGVLPRMALPFRFLSGGPMGTGNQWISWIDLEDEIEAILHLLHNPLSNGAYNLTAPHPVRQKEMAKAIGKALKSPSWLPVPGFVLKTLLGEMADELLLKGAKVLPFRLQEEGFEFHFLNVTDSVMDKLKRRN
ncbi:MAG TPA: TIGR01777 family oxidoreductase [Bacteroidales bacterium]|nr:TIGR01777 family oxidoreductase [Bacteroidales bacterium]